MFHYLTLGYDCSPAAALKNMDLREFALPFDWVVSNMTTLEACFQTNFEHFHRHLRFNHNKTRMIDSYGFQFPHDYPLTDTNVDENDIGEGKFGEENGKTICENWTDYYDAVLEKYKRRIDRFRAILSDDRPIIVLCRYSTYDVKTLQGLLLKYYKRDNVFFLNSSAEPFENNCIKNVYTEIHGVWNDVTIWKGGLEYIQKIADSTSL